MIPAEATISLSLLSVKPPVSWLRQEPVVVSDDVHLVDESA